MNFSEEEEDIAVAVASVALSRDYPPARQADE